MMTPLPPCPACSEFELWLSSTGANAVTIRCYFCGWSANVPVQWKSDAMSAAIAATVDAAKRTGGDDAVGAE